jgi:hypothetical protein
MIIAQRRYMPNCVGMAKRLGGRGAGLRMAAKGPRALGGTYAHVASSG